MRKLVVLAAALLAGCLPNPYAKFYQGAPDARARPGYVAPTGPLQVYSSNDFDRDVKELMRRGYVLVGQSSFNGSAANVKDSQMRDQAERVGAAVVVVASRYTNTVAGAIPLPVPQTATTTGRATATVYGSGVTATATGSGTSTTTSSQTVMVPYSVSRSDFAALYFARIRPVLGLSVVVLDDSTRQRLESNSGVRVAIVIENSPAFDADILPGDILLLLGADRIRSPDQYSELLAKYQGVKIEITLNRAGRELHKFVTLLTP